MLMATRPESREGWLVRWLNGCHRAQVYPVVLFSSLPAPAKAWPFVSRFGNGVCVIGYIKGDAIEYARVLMGVEEA